MRSLLFLCTLLLMLQGSIAGAAKGFLGTEAVPITREITQTPLAMSGKQLKRRLKPILQSHLRRHNYDSLIFINRYLSHFQTMQAQNPSASAVEAYWNYRSQAEAEARGENRGSHCFGLAKDLIIRLAQQNIPAAIVPSVSWVPAEGLGDPNKPRYDHAAAMVPFQNPSDPHDRGVVILDPGLNFSTPIVVRPQRPTGTRQGGMELTGTLNEKTGEVDISHPEQFHAFYQLKEWRNPDPRLTRLILTKNSKPEILARDEHGAVVAGLRLDLLGRRVMIAVEGQKTQFPFDDREGIRQAINSSLAHHLGLDAHTLFQRVIQVIDHQSTLQQLREITR